MALLVLVVGPLLRGQEPAAPPPAPQGQQQLEQKVQALEKRIEELEASSLELNERVGSRALLQSYSAQSLDLGGHLSSLWSVVRGKDGTDAGSYATLLELFLKARLAPEWSVFATPAFFNANNISLIDPHDPTFSRIDRTAPVDFGVLLLRAYAEYEPSDEFHLRAGIIGTPHGVINREYSIPSRITGITPMMTRLLTSNLLYPQVMVGTAASGNLHVGSNDAVEYDVYYGAETDDPDSPGGGARLGYRFGDLGLTVAADWAHGHRASFTEVTGLPAAFNLPVGAQFPFPSFASTRRSYDLFGIDFDLRHGDFWLQAEGYHSAESGTEDKTGVYIQPTWYLLPKWGVSYRFDYFNPGEGLGIATEHVFTTLFDPQKNVRLRLDLHHMELPHSHDALDFVDFSFSLSF
ncbi:MAG TPA: hypothetical protein VK348_08575 [Planctomycetota bacterium]|nr:hypothetical protein [Planctomycetota bacterium]